MAELIIAKQRNGPTGTVKLAFLREYTRFENLAARRRSRRDPADGRAHVDLDALAAQLPRAIRGLPGGAAARARRPGAHRRRQGQRVRPRRRPRWRARSSEAGAAMLACADIEEARRAARRPASRSRILVFGALSVSDLDGVFDARPDADDLDARRPRARCRPPPRAAGVALRYHLKIDTGMNRLGFRHDNLRAHLPGAARQPAPASSTRVYTHFATADDPEHPLFARAARNGSRRRWRRCAALGRRRVRAPRRQQRGAAARRARLVRLRAPGPAALRHRAAAARDRRCRSSPS